MLAIHIVAGTLTFVTIDLMRSMSEFAVTVRANDVRVLPYWRGAMYGIAVPVVVGYVWPIIRFTRARSGGGAADAVVARRAISFPTVIGAVSFAAWAGGTIFFPLLTYATFGDWSPELMSQQVLSPLVNGFFAATSAYLYTDWIARRMVIPRVFPGGGASQVRGAFTLGVRGRLFVFLAAVGFLPLFTMLGLARAARARFASGEDPARVLAQLDSGATAVFLVFLTLGLILTALLAKTFTAPLTAVAGALRRVRRGDVEARVPVDSGDELGLLEEGVNELAASLRERERILSAFGRVVEPAVRDRLLAGEIAIRGELRCATVMFCDLRGFTALAERSPPEQTVMTLNAFFATATDEVRRHGGFVDKFIGDALLVVFGLFDETEAADHGAAAAVACAHGLRARLEELNARRERDGVPALAIAIAVHTGEVVAGTIGAEDRHEYTVIGDTVNTAARLQQVCKDRGHAIVVSAATFERAAGGEGAMFVVARDSVKLRGRSEPVGYVALA